MKRLFAEKEEYGVLEVRYSSTLPDSFISRLQVVLRHLTLLGGSWRYGCCLCMQNPGLSRSSSIQPPIRSESTMSELTTTTASNHTLSRHNSSSLTRHNSEALSPVNNSETPTSTSARSGTATPRNTFAPHNLNLLVDVSSTNISVNEVKSPRPGVRNTTSLQHSFGILMQHGSSIFILSAGETTGKFMQNEIAMNDIMIVKFFLSNIYYFNSGSICCGE